MNYIAIPIALSLLVASCSDSNTSPDAGSSPDGTPSDASIGPDAMPQPFNAAHSVFTLKCGPCHTTGSSGGHSLGAAEIAKAYSDSQLPAYTITGTKGEAALFRIRNGSMPYLAGCTGDPVADSGDANCLTQAEQDAVQAWLDSEQ